MRWIVGDQDTAKKTRIVLVSLAIWILLDLLTKLAALAWLGEGEGAIELGGVLGLTLLINETLVAAPTLQDLQAARVRGAEVLVVVLAMALGALLAIPLANASRPVWKRALLVVGAVIVPVLIAAELSPMLAPSAEVPYRALMPMRILASSAVIVLLLRSVRATVLVVALAAILGGNLGNGLNAIYEPRGVIDFVYIPVIGPWVFNVADVAIVGGAILFAVGLVGVAIRDRPWRAARDPS